MSKFNYYFCDHCQVSWEEKFEEKYGECDSECPSCSKDFTPFESSLERTQALPKIINQLEVKFYSEGLGEMRVVRFEKLPINFSDVVKKIKEIKNDASVDVRDVWVHSKIPSESEMMRYFYEVYPDGKNK